MRSAVTSLASDLRGRSIGGLSKTHSAPLFQSTRSEGGLIVRLSGHKAGTGLDSKLWKPAGEQPPARRRLASFHSSQAASIKSRLGPNKIKCDFDFVNFMADRMRSRATKSAFPKESRPERSTLNKPIKIIKSSSAPERRPTGSTRKWSVIVLVTRNGAGSRIVRDDKTKNTTDNGDNEEAILMPFTARLADR